MKRIWNVSPHVQILDHFERGTEPAHSKWVEDNVANELVAGPDWSLENPRQPRKRNRTDPSGGAED